MYQTVLVPLDGSKRAEEILPHVEDMADKYGAKVVLLKVDEPAMVLDRDEVIDMEKYREASLMRKKESTAYLQTIRKRLDGKGIETQALIKYSASVVKEILSTAKDVKADILAMASHGHGGAARTFYGSIAVGVLNQIDRPLLLIRSRHVE